MYGFLLVFFSNFVPKMHRFWDIPLLSIQWPWNQCLGSLKVIENYPIQSGTHDFLLTFHRNYRPISHRFRDKRRCTSKIERKSPIFPPTPVFNAPDEGVPLGIWYQRKGSRMLLGWGYQMEEKFWGRFSRFDTTPACDGHPASQTRCRSKDTAYYMARITRSSVDADNGLDAFVGQSRSTNILGPFQVK